MPSTAAEGGHFFNAEYGVLVRAATDTFSTWKVEHMHGTTLQRKQPVWGTGDDSSFQQRSFAFLTPKTLVAAWMEKKGQLGNQRKRKFDKFVEDL